MPKQRTRQQVLEQESKGKLSILLSLWVANELPNDFGFDYDVKVTELNPENPDKQVVTGLSFNIQLKSTDDDCTNGFFHDLKTSDIDLFLKTSIPVLLVKYYSKCDSFFYEIIHSYVWDTIQKEDPNWKTSKYKRIHLKKKFVDLNIVKNEIQEVKTRIIRNFNYYNMNLGEGIPLSEFDDIRIRDLQEYKFKTIMVAFSEIKSGNEAKGIELLEEVCSSPKEDLLKFCAIINLIFQLNPLFPENHQKIINFSKEGILLCKKNGEDGFKEFLIITICNVFLVQNITKIGQLLFAKNISEKNKGIFSYFYDKDIIELYQDQDKINQRIQTSLRNLIKEKHILELVYASSILIETITYQVQKFVLADEKYLKIETDHRRSFIDNFEKLISIIDDENALQLCCYKLALYHFWICNYDKSEEYVMKAIEISKKLGYVNYIDSYNNLLEDVKNKKSPSNPNNRNQNSLDIATFEEIHDAMVKSLELQGIKITGDDEITKAIQLGLEDLDPSEYLKHCEHLRLAYLYPNQLGMNIGLFSLGPKVIWCKKSGAVEGVSLKVIFRFFFDFKCKKCDMMKNRDEKWVCTWKTFEEITLDPSFQEFLKTLHSRENV